MIRVADYIFKRIAEEGVKHVFFVPGGQAVYLCDALRRSSDIDPISCHHEQAAAMSALAYAKFNNKLGACMVTTGCAGTNTITGVLHAWQDSVPMIVVSGQQYYNQTIKQSNLPLRQVGVQEADIETLLKPITKYIVTLEDAKSVAYHLDKALFLAEHGRKGPVWIDVPMDVQNSMVDEDALNRFTDWETLISNEPEEYENASPIDNDIEYVVKSLVEAKRPVILAGNGVRTGDAIEELKDLVKTLDIPVVFTRLSSDIIPYDDRHSFGVVSGLAGASRHANFIIQNSDFVLSIGSRLSLDTTGSDIEKFAREANIIVVDIDKVEHLKNGVKYDKLILSGAKIFIQTLLKYIKATDVKLDLASWIEKCHHWKEVFPLYPNESKTKKPIDSKWCMALISESAPDKTVFISDAGFTGASTPCSTRITGNQRMIHSFAQGEMGFSLPGAIGVAEISEGPVVSYTGDGSIMMNLQEFQTLSRYKLNIKLVIMNNNGYSGVRHGQKAHFRGKSVGVDPETGVDFPDYGKIAEAFNINYIKVNEASELSGAIKELFSNDLPLIVEVMTDPEQIDLHNGLVTFGKRKYGFRPIEDQSPYIDRDLFFKEMIITPDETSYGTPV